METNKKNVLKLELVTVNKSVFKQLRIWDGIPTDHKVEILGWVGDSDGVYVVAAIDGKPFKILAVDYVATLPTDLWRNGIQKEIMDKFTQIFIM